MESRTEQVHGCVVVYGQPSIPQITAAMGSIPDGISSSRAAWGLGANMVIGVQENVDKLLASPEFVDKAKQKALAEAGHTPLTDGAMKWLTEGERGASSSFLFSYVTGVNLIKPGIAPHPLDPSDFRRCRLAVEQVPELQDNLLKVKEASQHWAALIGDWDNLCKLMDEETPEWRKCQGRAKLTYKRMKELFSNVEREGATPLP